MEKSKRAGVVWAVAALIPWPHSGVDRGAPIAHFFTEVDAIDFARETNAAAHWALRGHPNFIATHVIPSVQVERSIIAGGLAV